MLRHRSAKGCAGEGWDTQNHCFSSLQESNQHFYETSEQCTNQICFHYHRIGGSLPHLPPRNNQNIFCKCLACLALSTRRPLKMHFFLTANCIQPSCRHREAFTSIAPAQQMPFQLWGGWAKQVDAMAVFHQATKARSRRCCVLFVVHKQVSSLLLPSSSVLGLS